MKHHKHHKNKKSRKGPDNSVLEYYAKMWDSFENRQKSRRCDECGQSIPSNQQQFPGIGQAIAMLNPQTLSAINNRNIAILNPGFFVPPEPFLDPRFLPFTNLGHIYPRTPFDTRAQVQFSQSCHSFKGLGTGGARDIWFSGIRLGEPVFAVEPGTVIFVKRDATCFSQPDPNAPDGRRLIDRNTNREVPDNQCFANQIVVRGSDEAYTEYSHLLPSNLRVGSSVRAGDLLGNVDLSGPTTGPHVHFARYNPNFFIINPTQARRDSAWSSLPTCDWSMFDKGNLVTLFQR